MADIETKSRLMGEIAVLVFAVVCLALIVADLFINVRSDIQSKLESKNRVTMKVGNEGPETLQELSLDDMEEILSRGD